MKTYIIPKADIRNYQSEIILANSGDQPDAGETKVPVTDGGAAKSTILVFD